MNFVEIFFQILITTTFYKRGFCPNPDIEYTAILSNVNAWEKQTGIAIGNFSTVYLHKYNNLDNFYMHDANDPALHENVFQNARFSSSQFEFISLYDLKLMFLFRRNNGSLVYVLCQFLSNDGVQIFFNSVNSKKPRAHKITIHRWARYTIPVAPNTVFNPQMVSYPNGAELGVRSISNWINVANTVYYITHISDTTGEVEVDLIFVSKGFKIVAPFDNNIVALCISHAREVGFLVKFPTSENLQNFKNDHMFEARQSDKPCDFPFAVYEYGQNYTFLND